MNLVFIQLNYGRHRPKNIENIVRSFLPQSKNFEVIPMTQGLINDSYKISFTDQAYFLQRLNTQVFKHPTGLMHNIVQWQKSHCTCLLPLPYFFKNISGELFGKNRTRPLLAHAKLCL
jgi:hypothetical protein